MIYNIIILLLFSQNVFSEIVWADKLVDFSSQYGEKQHSAKQILGPPQIQTYLGTTPLAWRPKTKTSLTGEFITVAFSKNIKAEYIYIHENFNAGSITEIILFDNNDNPDTIYKPKKLFLPEESTRIFKYKIPGGAIFPVKKMKLILSTSRIPGFNEIEAVGLSTNEYNSQPSIAEIDEKLYPKLPENLGLGINSEYPELAPVINSKGDKIFYTRNYHPENIGYNKLQDIWYSKMKNGIFETPKNIGYPLNDEFPNFAISVTPDDNALIVGNVYNKSGKPNSGISISHRDKDKWTYPKEIEIKDYEKIGNLSSYYFAADGRTLLLAYEAKESIGGTDMWVSFLESDGKFSKPRNLGEMINTADNENSPFLAVDGKTLFFSSRGYPGYGSYDLFYTKRLDSTWKKWSKPVNLGSKINSAGWDAYFTIPASGEYAYFVSTNNSIGAEDIFRVELPESLKPEEVLLISGRVLNSKNNSPVKATIYYERLSDGEQLGIARSNSETGEYNIVLPSGEVYGIHAHSEGFVAINENFDLSDNSQYKEINRDLYLVPIEKGQKFRINNIFFNFAKYNLLPNSYSELNRLSELMKNRPNLRILIEGHTDDIGTQERNLKLSKKRAQAVKEYLVSKGISESRIEIKGYGKSKPLLNEETEEARKQNRRVEFVIIQD